MTSLRLIFIQLSQLTRWPLYVSPFFSSTSWENKEQEQLVILECCRILGLGANTNIVCLVLTMGWFWVVFSRDNGSYKIVRGGERKPFTLASIQTHTYCTCVYIYTSPRYVRTYVDNQLQLQSFNKRVAYFITPYLYFSRCIYWNHLRWTNCT